MHVVSGSLDTSIRVWDAISGTCKHTLMGHQSLTSGMELRQNILVSGNADSTVKVWDTTNGQCLQTLSGMCGLNMIGTRSNACVCHYHFFISPQVQISINRLSHACNSILNLLLLRPMMEQLNYGMFAPVNSYVIWSR